jgi:hypothetical protein
MTSDKKICPQCKGSKIMVGLCNCNAEWRGAAAGDDSPDDCICEPDTECPECKGKGYIE